MGKWALDHIPWHEFDRDRVNAELVPIVKAASMVEYNATDYRTYLQAVFRDDPRFVRAVDNWTEEELQHGRALARWAKLADPDFDFEASFERFTGGFRPPLDVAESVRGSLTGELIARCMVETGTNSFYSALAAATDEPVLKAICRNIAADEYAHYSLFHNYMTRYLERERLGVWDRLKIAFARIAETEDDELAYAYYCGNTPVEQIGIARYDRRAATRKYHTRIQKMYRERHIRKAMQMVAKAAGVHPQSWLTRAAGWFVWTYLRIQARREGSPQAETFAFASQASALAATSSQPGSPSSQ
jgi:rubrerythrin